MRLFKSPSFKSLDGAVAAQMAEDFVAWCEHRGESITHAGLSHYLGCYLGFVTAQAIAYGDLRDGEAIELRSLYSVAATMTAIHSLAKDKMIPVDEFDQIVTDMNGYTLGFGMDGVRALGTFLEKRKRKYKVSKETLGGALVHSMSNAKLRWPGGPAFERP